MAMLAGITGQQCVHVIRLAKIMLFWLIWVFQLPVKGGSPDLFRHYKEKWKRGLWETNQMA